MIRSWLRKSLSHRKRARCGGDLRRGFSTRSAPIRAFALALFLIVPMAATACFKQSNTYPVEVLKEMHYAQFNRPQEPPRLAPPASSVAFGSGGGPETQLTVPDRRERPYDLARASELYRVNCSVCHGETGGGDGPAAASLTSPKSYFATAGGTGGPYTCASANGCPPNLRRTVQTFNEQTAFAAINSGVVVMPRFGALLPEEDIWDIVRYLFDKQDGIASRAP